ncbi:MAG: alkyl hydroperoxide reductase subunit F [Ideonella sp.]|nr:alkyl hydroperoxide reductase subunit F [Ideonella sp.]MCC7456419.1 alkyl hydroperoxide reductase subunit F [Nitrospira sp.]
MLDSNLRDQLRAHLARVTQPIVIVASLDAGAASAQMRELLTQIAELSERIELRFDGEHARRPSFSITRAGTEMGLRFAAVPLGHEFTSLVLALLQAGGVAPKVDAEVVEQIRSLDGNFEFETWMSLTCHNCPDVVQALNLMAVLNPRIRHTAIDGALFQAEVQQRQIMAVPMVMLNGQPFGSGRMEIGEILTKVDRGAAARDAARLAGKPVFDVLVVGGGPAGAAAAVYAARKGIKTGIVAERFGGQTLDTLGIENYISVSHTTGPQFAAALEQHAREYGVDIISGQRVRALEPARGPGVPATVVLDNGAELRARSVVLAPGARWREVGVPGEQQYRNKGVAYCPHCDGPLFKGRPVAVIGGGNSGVEAAIDLAGIASHVTLVEFAPQLKADAVLVRKLESLSNVAIVRNAKTTEITGDGQRVDGLRYVDRAGGAVHEVPVSGVFVQIGLVPNTEWLRGAVELSSHGEIVVDARGATTASGVFAAGDATTVPYKQIVVAAGEGSKAALSAFDHLIREPAPEPAHAPD